MENALALTLPPPTTDLRGYLAAIQQFPLLDEREERDLVERYRESNDLSAAWRIVTSHLRLVAKLARGYRGYGLPEEDIIQEGNVGLMKALKRFDLSFGARFASFAVYHIRAEIHEFILRNWRIVKVATTKAQRKLFFNLRSARRTLAHVTPDEAAVIAEDLGVKPEEVTEMDGRLRRLDAAFDHRDDGWSPAHWLEGSAPSPERVIEEAEYTAVVSGALREALDTLDERSRAVLEARYLSQPKHTLRELADRYGVSVERVRQIEVRAIERLREALGADAAPLPAS